MVPPRLHWIRPGGRVSLIWSAAPTPRSAAGGGRRRWRLIDSKRFETKLKNMKTKTPQTLEIEWKRLDKNGKTCSRCADTGAALRDLAQRLKACCGPKRLRV